MSTDAAIPTPPCPAAATPVDLAVLRRLDANITWLVAAARPLCGSEPESYGIADAEAAHAELQEILRTGAAAERAA